MTVPKRVVRHPQHCRAFAWRCRVLKDVERRENALMQGQIYFLDILHKKPILESVRQVLHRGDEKMTDVQKTEQEQAVEAAEQKANETNSTRSGKGTRVRVGQTRGRNPQVISWEAFDESQPDTLPSTWVEFMSLTGYDKAKDPESVIVPLLIAGFNSQAYVAASDPIAEFVNPAWEDERKKQFRIVVRNYASMNDLSIEEAVALIKPGVEKSFLKTQAVATA